MIQKLNTETSYWVCVRYFDDARKNPEVRIDTISFYRKDSIKILIAGTSMTWEGVKEFGWECEKLTLTIQKEARTGAGN